MIDVANYCRRFATYCIVTFQPHRGRIAQLSSYIACFNGVTRRTIVGSRRGIRSPGSSVIETVFNVKAINRRRRSYHNRSATCINGGCWCSRINHKVSRSGTTSGRCFIGSHITSRSGRCKYTGIGNGSASTHRPGTAFGGLGHGKGYIASAHTGIGGLHNRIFVNKNQHVGCRSRASGNIHG